MYQRLRFIEGIKNIVRLESIKRYAYDKKARVTTLLFFYHYHKPVLCGLKVAI